MVMNVENPNNFYREYYWIYSFYRSREAHESDEDFTDLYLNNPTQGESQKVPHIEKVLNVIDNYGPINTTDITIKSKLSSGSINRTLKLLRNKNLVTLNQINDKQNNAKFYTLNNNRAIVYHEQLISWKKQKEEKQFWIKFRKNRKFDNELDKILSKEWYDIELKLTSKQKKYFDASTKNILVGNVPLPRAHEIRLKYVNGYYCHDCFENGLLSEFKRTKDETDYCKHCGVEKPIEDQPRLDKRKMKELSRKDNFDADRKFRKIFK